jgi:hypothetical protein
LAAYQDRALEPEESETLERHVASCESCRAEIAALARLAFRLDFPGTDPLAVSTAPRVPRGWLAAACAAAVLVAGALLAPRLGIRPFGDEQPIEAESTAEHGQAHPAAGPAATPPEAASGQQPSPVPAAHAALPAARESRQVQSRGSDPAADRVRTALQRSTPRPGPAPVPSRRPRPTPRPTPESTVTPPPEPEPTPELVAPTVEPARDTQPSAIAAVDSVTSAPEQAPDDRSLGLSFRRDHLMTPGITAAQRYSNLAVRSYLDGDSDKALKYLESALHRDGRLSEACFNLALLYEENGRQLEAARQWGRYVALVPDGPQSAVARRRLREARSR